MNSNVWRSRWLWGRFVLTSATRNLWRAPRRTLISILAIASAVAALLIFRSFVDGVKRQFRHHLVTSSYGHYQILKQGYRDKQGEDPFAYPILQEDVLRKNLTDTVGPLAMFSRRQRFHALIHFGERSLGAVGLGVDAKEEAGFLTMLETMTGKSLADSGADGVYLGVGLARQLKLKAGDLITLLVTTAKGSINAMDFEVAGTFRAGVVELDETVFFIHVEAAKSLMRIEGAPMILLGLNTEDELAARPAMEKMLADKHPDLQLVHWHEVAGAMFDNTMGWLESLFGVFQVIVLVIATLSIINVFSLSLLERTGEFGTLRAIGTHRGELVALIVTESLIQAFLGGLSGVLLGILGIKGLLARGLTMPPPLSMSVPFHVELSIPWEFLPLVLILSTVIAGGSGLFPALRMAKLNIVNALGRAE